MPDKHLNFFMRLILNKENMDIKDFRVLNKKTKYKYIL